MNRENASDVHGKLIKHVSASGFPLQIAVATAINRTTVRHGWTVRFSEHSWKHPDTNDSGFVDLVLCSRKSAAVMVVECKRSKDEKWVFLCDESQQSSDSVIAKGFVFGKNGPDLRRFEWLDLTVSPISRQSSFCAVRGSVDNSAQHKDSQPRKPQQVLLERLASSLVPATECIALEDKRLSLDDRYSLRVYFNVIVTTATLHVCLLDSNSISLDDGDVKHAQFVEVPFVRFRKQLSTTYRVPDIYNVFGDREVEKAKENTVFVVNSMHLEQFLTDFEIDADETNERYLGNRVRF